MREREREREREGKSLLKTFKTFTRTLGARGDFFLSRVCGCSCVEYPEDSVCVVRRSEGDGRESAGCIFRDDLF